MKAASDYHPMLMEWHKRRCEKSEMETGLLPKKFEIQFRQTNDGQYTGVLLIEGMQMGVGTPKSLEEITAFLMPSWDIRNPNLDQART